MLLTIPKSEFKERQQKFFNKLSEENCDGAIIFAVTDIFYLTGFHFHSTERPMGVLVDPDHKVHLFVPALEHNHAEEYAVIDHVHSYPEYPGIKHPMEYLKEVLQKFGFEGKTIGYDSLGYGSPMGYSGPSVDEFLEVKEFVSLKGVIEKLRFVKSENEIELIKESCRWGNLAHRLLQKYTKAGLSEIEITSKASTEATMAMIETLGPNYKPHGRTAYAIFRGPIGQ
ncbi:aminopeptidase P family protein, partial [Halomonas sp. MG34]|nr:aminopeptidase P family protein [Halomonas sp. MG34]